MKANKSIQISKISLDLAGNKVELTVEQAKELQNILNELFVARPNVDKVGDYPIVYPMIYPSWPQSPTIPEFPYQGWQTWCEVSDSTFNCKLM